MKNKVFVTLFVLGCALLTACDGEEAVSQGSTIKVGAVLSLSGEYAQYGVSVKNGIELAIAKINAEGGINGNDYTIAFEDSQSTVDGAKTAFNSLVNSGVSIIIGPETTDIAAALIPLAARNQVYLISPSASSPSLSEIPSQGYFYRICASDGSEAEEISIDIPRDIRNARYLKRGYNRALVIVRKDNPYTEGIWREFGQRLNERKIDYEILRFDHSTLAEDDEDVMVISDTAAGYLKTSDDESKTGVIVIFGYADDVYFFLKEFKRKELDVLVYTSSAVDTSQFYVDAVDVSEGLVFPRVFDPNDTENSMVVEFVANYKEEHQKVPDLFTAYGYDAGLLIAGTLKIKGIDEHILEPLNFRLHVNDMHFQGVTGTVDFEIGSGDVAKTPALYKMKKFGEAVLLTQYEREQLIETQKRLRERMEGRNN